MSLIRYKAIHKDGVNARVTYMVPVDDEETRSSFRKGGKGKNVANLREAPTCYNEEEMKQGMKRLPPPLSDEIIQVAEDEDDKESRSSVVGVSNSSSANTAVSIGGASRRSNSPIPPRPIPDEPNEIGRASCRERV